VLQADTMIPCLTPRDILTHSAFTRLPSSWSAARKIDRVEHTLRALQLERVQHTPVGDEDVRGVSGGEKKRTNIGIELVNSPSLLILDGQDTIFGSASLSTHVRSSIASWGTNKAHRTEWLIWFFFFLRFVWSCFSFVIFQSPRPVSTPRAATAWWTR